MCLRRICMLLVLTMCALFTGLTALLWTSIDVSHDGSSGSTAAAAAAAAPDLVAERQRNELHARAASAARAKTLAGSGGAPPPLPGGESPAVAAAPAAAAATATAAAAPPGLRAATAAAAAAAAATPPVAPPSGAGSTIRGCTDSSTGSVTLFVWAPGDDFKGGDLGGLPVNAANARGCCAVCAGTEGCAAWTFVKANTACWLKRSIDHLPDSHLDLVLGKEVTLNDATQRAAEAAQLAAAALIVDVEYAGTSGGALLVSGVHVTTFQAMLHAAEGIRKRRIQPFIDDVGWTLPPSMPRPGIVVVAHNRPEYLQQSLNALFSLVGIRLFQVFVSLDDFKVAGMMKAAIPSHLRQKVTVWEKPFSAPTNAFQRTSLFLISDHYRFILNTAFPEGGATNGLSHLILIEEDLRPAPDFLSLFLQTAQILDADPTVWCVSAWSDLGSKEYGIDEVRVRSVCDFKYVCELYPSIHPPKHNT